MSTGGRPDAAWFADLAAEFALMFFAVRVLPDVVFEFVSEGMLAQLVGVRAERSDAAAEDLLDRIHPDSAGNLAALLAMRPGRNAGLELTWRHADGRTVTGRGWARAGARPDGSVIVEGIIQDVTESAGVDSELRRSEERHRLLAENAWDVIWSMALDGSITYVSPAVERVRGITPAEAIVQSLDQIHPPESAARNRDYFARLFAAIANGVEPPVFRGELEYFRRDDSIMTGEVQVIPHIDSDGKVVEILGVTRDISERKLLEVAEARYRSLATRLRSELDSAAQYIASILPGDLEGPVQVSSRYLPSQEVGGDCLNYAWIDSDHLMVYLIDVSGHGAGAALLAVSIHNMLRSGSLPKTTLLAPEHVLSELNRHFRMENQGGDYFTIWYGVYQASTRVLRYAGAGHPPALVLSGGSATQLPGQSLPVGMFRETEFTASSYVVPANCQILLYSDGAFDMDLPDGLWGFGDFVALCRELAADPDWSLDELIERLRRLTDTDVFEDDCSLVRLNID